MKIFNIFTATILLVISMLYTYQTVAQERNPLRMTLYVIETTGVAERAAEAGDYMGDHIAHQDNLERQGIMFGAGGLRSETTGGPVQGLIIIRAESFEEARRIADSDPMHANGLRTYTLRRWSLNEGTVNIQVNFSDQSVKFE